MKKYFNNLMVFPKNSNQILNRKPTFDEVLTAFTNRLYNNIITESVFKSELFKSLFNDIKTKSQLFFTTEDLKQYFPINSKVFKILSKNKNQNQYKLYVFHNDFSNKETVKTCLLNICADNTFDDNDINSVFYGLKHAFGMFTVIPNNNEFAMLWVKPNQSLEDFSHEFIHYLEWIGGIYGRNIKIDLSEENNLFENEDEFKLLFDLSDEDIEYIFNKAEYQTLLNDFLNKLANLKQKYYSNLTGHQFSRTICFFLLRDRSETVKQYLEKINLFEYFNELNSNYDLAMIVGYNCLNYKITNIKNHIFGRFIKD